MKVKRIIVGSLFCVAFIFAVLVGFFLYLRHTSGPPKEAKLMKNFNDHRAAFEKLREMLVADTQVRRVADWGVETTKGTFSPVAGRFPDDRYAQYLALLKEAGGGLAYRVEGEHPNPGILVWASGFGGDTAHVGISWDDLQPTNQVTSLDEHIQKRKDGEERRVVYRHIDGNWYLWTDW